MAASTVFGSKSEYDKAVSAAVEAARAYYETDHLVMDDATYDTLVAQILASEEAHPDWKASDLSAVAGGVSAGGDVDHIRAMLSLAKASEVGEMEAFVGRRDDTAYTVEPKLDGVALSCVYVDGSLDRIVTRGDGRTGEDVTAQLTSNTVVDGLPAQIPVGGVVDVRGECVLTEDDFAQAQKGRVEVEGKTAFVNRRNAVAGIIRSRDRVWTAHLSFRAYDVEGLDVDTGSGRMDLLETFGFRPALRAAEGGGVVTGGVGAVLDAVERIGAVRASLPFEIDGAVIKVDDIAVRDSEGATGSHPRWAVAFKYPAEERATRVVDIDITPGRTGLLVPRAVLEPVFVGGTTVSFATLHHPGEVERLDVRVGDHVMVKRAGDVIPRVEGVLVDKRDGTQTRWVAPTECPRCGADIDRGEARWRCTRGRACGAVEWLTYAAGRDALDIEGLGETVLAGLVASGRVGDLADLFTLEVGDLMSVERVGVRTAEKIVAGLEAARGAELYRWVTALGLRMTGRRMSRRLAAEFGTWEGVLSATVEALTAVEGVGEVRAATIRSELDDLADVLVRLGEAGVAPAPQEAQVQVAGGALEGERVVITGTVPGMSRSQAQQAAEMLGAKVSSSVTSKTTLVVAGDGGGSKLAKAEKLGVRVMDAAEFAALAT